MNWKLILQLSLFGLAMGIATVFVIPSNVEPLTWLIIFVICAYVIGKRAPGHPFKHGFMVSIVNSIWITACHMLLISSYLPRHPDEAEMMLHLPLSRHPRILMAITGPLIGVVSGLILGLFAFVAYKLLQSPPPKAVTEE
jgi:hypothetical protein